MGKQLRPWAVGILATLLVTASFPLAAGATPAAVPPAAEEPAAPTAEAGTAETPPSTESAPSTEPAGPPPGVVDSDGDGISDEDETSGVLNRWPSGLAGLAVSGDPTDPATADSDGDGMSDGAEIGTVANGRMGTGTDPNRADTDGDGLSDGAEGPAFTDPLSPDTDLDGLDDGEELRSSSPTASSDPLVRDRDFDFLPDGFEVLVGSDPAERGAAELATGQTYSDVPPGSPYYYAVEWAGRERIVRPQGSFGLNGVVRRADLALMLQRYAIALGRRATASTPAYVDLGAVSPRTRVAIRWAGRTGIIPAPGPRFHPDRVVNRNQAASVVFRFATWAGFAPQRRTDTFSDTGMLPSLARGAIGWLQGERIVTGSTFSPSGLLRRGPFVVWLHGVDGLTGAVSGVDTDGDGVTDQQELLGTRNRYDAAPSTVPPCATTTAPVLPPPADGGAPTSPNDPDSDDDGVSDGREMLLLRSDPNRVDTDTDCLTDGQEDVGWNLDVDEDGLGCPGGGSGGCPGVTRYVGHSDPLVEDTDGDGLDDAEERLLRTDAELTDTDTDGLDDFDEWNRWFTSPLSVDSDQDARGGDRSLPPTQSLFDGIELRDIGTSPSLGDTDGDGASDADELDDPVRSPLLAELPGFDMDLAGGTTVRLRRESETAAGGSVSVGLTNSVETSSSQTSATSTTQRLDMSYEYETNLSFTLPALSATAGVRQQFGIAYGTDETREFSREESQTAAQETAETTETNWTRLDSVIGGEISQGMVFRNTGPFTYEIASVGYTIQLFNRETQIWDVVGTMTVPLDGIALGPGAETEPIQVTAQDVNAELVRQFLAAPSAMHFVTSNIEFLDSEGRNFEFLTERTFAQTAQVVVEFAPGRVETHNVATNVDRLQYGTPGWGLRRYPGVPVGSRHPEDPVHLQGVMDLIGYPRCEGDVPGPGCYTTRRLVPPGETEAIVQLHSVDGVSQVDDPPDGSSQCRSQWKVFTSAGVEVRDDFDDLRLRAGDGLTLYFASDCDRGGQGDGLPDGIEAALGACVEPDVTDELGADCDNDGLSDLQELNGWIVGFFPDPDDPDTPCPQENPDPSPTGPQLGGWDYDSERCPWTPSNPAVADSDADGLTDLQERNGGARPLVGSERIDAHTNPLDADTDGDGDGDVPGGDRAPLHSSVRYVAQRPCSGPDCWPACEVNCQLADLDRGSVPDLSLALAGADPQNPDPREDVRSFWVASGTYLAPAGGFELPAGVAVYGGFRGDETRLSERTPDPMAATAVRLRPSTPAIPSGDPSPVVSVTNDRSTFDGFRVQSGDQGIVGSGDHAVLRNLLVSNNSDAGFLPPSTLLAGGVTWTDATDLQVSDVTITSNRGFVGGVYLDDVDDALVRDSRISFNASLDDHGDTLRGCNTTPAPDCVGGGGVAVHDSDVRFEGVRVSDNTALVGGGLDISGSSTVRLVSSRVTRNEAAGDEVVVGRGGGLHVHDGARALLSNCLVDQNLAVVGPRWTLDPAADGFGGGLFAHDDADVRVINCTFAANRGTGVVVAGDEMVSTDTGMTPDQAATPNPSTGAQVRAQNSVFYGNTTTWQPTYMMRKGSDANEALGAARAVGLGLLGFSVDGQSGRDNCLGDDTTVGGDPSCIYWWFTGLGYSSSTEFRSDRNRGLFDGTHDSGVTTSLVGSGSTHGTITDGVDCHLDYFGRTEVPTVNNDRGVVACVTGATDAEPVLRDRVWLGLRGRGFQGRAQLPVPAPAVTRPEELYRLPSYELAPTAIAIDRGNEFIDWDPWEAGLQDAPATDLAGRPRVAGAGIDLGAYEVQPPASVDQD